MPWDDRELEDLQIPNDPFRAHILAAAGHIPSGIFVITSSWEGKKAGVLARSVQLVATEPLLVCVSMRKGHPIEPLIRDSARFALCRVDPNDKLILRKFNEKTQLASNDDPFAPFPYETLETGAPVLTRCIAALDCEVLRHIDIEAECELYIGQLKAGRVYATSEWSA